jgi:hypothetical protein
MMEAARTSETLVNFYQTTQHYNPEDSHLSSKKYYSSHYPSLYTGQSGQNGVHVQPLVMMVQNTDPGSATALLQPLVEKSALDQTWTSKTATLINVQVFLI